MSHHVDDIRTALETSPQVREAVAAMLAALGETRECGVYSFTDTCDYEHTVETRFAKYQQAVDFERWVAIASKVIDKWIMESRDDDMDAKQTVAVQKAIGATKALVSIANGAEWSAYMQLETDTRGIVTERMATVILDALQQPPAAPPPSAGSEDAVTVAQQRITELEAERDSAVRDANRRAFALKEIEVTVKKAITGYIYDEDGDALETEFKDLVKRIKNIVRTGLPSTETAPAGEPDAGQQAAG